MFNSWSTGVSASGTQSSHICVERERLREREREARAQMTCEADQRVPQDGSKLAPLFGEIVRLNPKSNDKERQQIERKLGRYDEVKHLLDQDSTNLYGIDGQPPPSPAPSVNLASALTNVHEFKKPNACSQPQQNRPHHQHHHHHSSQRGGFVKPADGKPGHGGRGFYPGQTMKRDSSSSNDFRSSSGIVPVKGPPTSSATVQNSGSGSGSGSSNASHSSSSSTSSGNRSSGSHEFPSKARNLPKLHLEPREPSLLPSNLNGAGAATSQANVENILDEMTSAIRTPLTAIAATPRKEMQSNFIFNPVSGQMESLLPVKPPVADKNSKVNLLKDILAPAILVPLTSVFKPGDHANPLKTLSPCNSPTTLTTTATFTSKSKTSTSSAAAGTPTTTTSTTSSSKTTSASLPFHKSISLSEDSDDDDDEEDDDDDDDNNEDSEEENTSSKPVPTQPAPKPEPESPAKLETATKTAMSPEEVRGGTSSSEDSDTDSGSDSEDSSSDSPSPTSAPVPDLLDQVDRKREWNLTNFLPPLAHGNTTPAPQTPQACDNGEKSKTDDSDSSGDTTQKSQVASSSSSESDGDSVKSPVKPCKPSSRTNVSTKVIASDDSSDEDGRGSRGNYPRRSSTSSQSSDDSDRPTKIVNGSGSSNNATNNNNNNSNSNNNNNNSGANSSNANNANANSNVTVVGVVRPHQRKPPSPQVFNRGRLSPPPAAEDRMGFVPQHTMQMQPAPEPQFVELPGHSDSDGVVGSMNRGRVNDSFQMQRAASSMNAVKSVEKAPAQPTKSGKGRKPKSPALVPAAEVPAKKKRGRKKKEIREISDSEDEERKVKVPERKRPGRPPKRSEPDGDWAGPRRKVLDKFPTKNVWGKRERRDSTLRSSFTVDSDSDEQIPVPPKPTARVIPAVKKKESARVSRDSSCESSRNDSDFNAISGVGGAKNNNVTKAEESPPKLDVEGIAVQDKKKRDTLRKLFPRPQEGGGKNGGKGGGKGKFGVIVVESNSLSPRPSLHRISEVPRVNLASPLQQSMNDLNDIPRMNDRVPSLPTISRRQDRVPEMDSNAPPTTPSTSIEPIPPLTYNENGQPSLMCKIDLSKISYILAKKRPEEIRIKAELSDTRQTTMDLQSGPPPLDVINVPLFVPMSNDDEKEDNIDHSRVKKPKKRSAKRKYHVKEESPPQIYQPAVHTPSVDPESDSMSSDVEPRRKTSMMMRSSKQRMSMRPPESMLNLMNSCYPLPGNSMPQNSMCIERVSDNESWRSDASSCSTCSSSPVSCRNDIYGSHNKHPKHRHSSRKCRKTRNEHSQRHSSLNDAAPSLMHVPGTSYDRTMSEPTMNPYQMNMSELVRPVVPTHHGIYYSYLEHKVSEEINSESDNISPNVYLTEAKRLKYAADTERDKVAQGMQYLEAILSFVLTGHVLERKNQMETAFSMYSETLKLIVYISKKFRTFCMSAAQSNIPNKIAILSLRCESILNLKLYTMREPDVREVHNSVTDYFSKSIPVEACLITNQGIPSPPTPSPASSVGSNSSGYSSGGVTHSIAVPVAMHQKLQKEHNFYSNLIASFSYWEEADKLIFSGGNKDFFIELDRFCGPLTLHSSLKDLVHYVRVGIQRLKAIISHHQRV